MGFTSPSLLPGPGRRLSAPRMVRLWRGLRSDMIQPARERFGPAQRVRLSRDYARIKAEGTALRGRHCLMLVLPWGAEPTRAGFIASRKGVGGAVQRNRARRRLREIVRRRWTSIAPEGWGLVFIAYRSALTASHEDLVADVGRLIANAGAERSTRDAIT